MLESAGRNRREVVLGDIETLSTVSNDSCWEGTYWQDFVALAAAPETLRLGSQKDHAILFGVRANDGIFHTLVEVFGAIEGVGVSAGASQITETLQVAGLRDLDLELCWKGRERHLEGRRGNKMANLTTTGGALVLVDGSSSKWVEFCPRLVLSSMGER